MFERFTEKSIKVVTYSQEEAIKAKHASLYPEHILIGILREGTGIAARFLKASGLKLETLREAISEIIITKQGESNFPEVLSFSPAIKRVLKEASDQAKLFGTNYINPEHLFLAVLNNNDSSVANLLMQFNIDVERIKSSVLRVIEKKRKSLCHPENSKNAYSFIPRFFSMPAIFEEKDSEQIINSSVEKLKQANLEVLGTEQIFLSMLEDKDSPLSKLLEIEGVTQDNFKENLQNIESRADEFEGGRCLFTPRAFYAINTAYEFAKEVGITSITPEHILLGLLKEKKGIACLILKKAGINMDMLYNKVISPLEKQNPTMLTIIRLAKQEAIRSGLNIVGTEQILLGILGEGTSIAAIVLKDLGITLRDVRLEIEKIIGYSDEYSKTDISFTPRAKKVLDLAWTEAKKLNLSKVEPEQLLSAMIEEKKCMAMKILESLGVDTLEIKQGILKSLV